jgi:PhzF family phenazine biosynthesis protein
VKSSNDIPVSVINAFSDDPFGGNPAAVCRLQAWLSDDILRKIALQTGLPITSFLVREGNAERLRWFAREGNEVQSLCGHGTVAAAHVCLRLEQEAPSTVAFQTRAGLLVATREGDAVAIDFPRWTITRCDPPPGLADALGLAAQEYWTAGRDYLAVYANEAEVRSLRPDFERLLTLGRHGFIATGPGLSHDCVSRFFCPSFGIGENEDPVTGSAHCSIAPLWAERLGKQEIRAYQASGRSGDLACRVKPDAVRISARAAIFLRGTISI